MQKIVMTDSGVVRFVENEIVSHLLESYPGGLNAIARKFHASREDYEQLTMLIGYSVSGFGDLSTSSRRAVASADQIASALSAKARAERDDQ